MNSCYFCLFPYECGCQKATLPLKRPEGYPEAPDKYLCPCCNKQTRIVYKEDDQYFAICFIPCCIWNKTPPYLACEECDFRLPSIELNQCGECYFYFQGKSEYCASCGTQCKYTDERNKEDRENKPSDKKKINKKDKHTKKPNNEESVTDYIPDQQNVLGDGDQKIPEKYQPYMSKPNESNTNVLDDK